MNPAEGGYNFTSTDFDYQVSPGRESGNWLVYIIINDVHNQIVFNFDIWTSGTARLSVNDYNRQSISYQGNIVTKEKE